MSQEIDETKVTYLGDGVYAEICDAYSVRLYTQSGDNIYLERREFEKLKAFAFTEARK